MNRSTSLQTKISALLAFITKLGWTKFVAVSDNDPESISFMILLEEHLRPRNMKMIDWLVFTSDYSRYDISPRFQTLDSDLANFLLITNNLAMTMETFIGATVTEYQHWVVVSDLNVEIFANFHFPPNTYSLTPRMTREVTLNGSVDDVVHSIGLALSARSDTINGACPRMRELRR